MFNLHEKISGFSIGRKEIKKGVYYSDHLHYQDILHCCVEKYPMRKNTNRWLLIIHENEPVNLLINEELPLAMSVQAKNKINQ